MSMSQEEIEALMSGAGDFTQDDQAEEEVDQSEQPQEDSVQEDGQSDSQAESSEENFDDILAGIDGIVDDESTEGSEENFDDILAGIDGVTDDSPTEKADETSSKGSSTDNIEELIEQNKYPYPVEKEHKVVNQLNEVAADSEQKASQIFDVLSFILDENNEISNFQKNNEEFLVKQIELLEALTAKFPNIEVFKENLEKAKELIESSKKTTGIVDNENMKIFEAMELMQYHDINRQKIERVMSVIKKLNDYLNGIFEDESDRPEVQIAKHISGDSRETVEADDLEALITEFAEKDQ